MPDQRVRTSPPALLLKWICKQYVWQTTVNNLTEACDGSVHCREGEAGLDQTGIEKCVEAAENNPRQEQHFQTGESLRIMLRISLDLPLPEFRFHFHPSTCARHIFCQKRWYHKHDRGLQCQSRCLVGNDPQGHPGDYKHAS